MKEITIRLYDDGSAAVERYEGDKLTGIARAKHHNLDVWFVPGFHLELTLYDTLPERPPEPPATDPPAAGELPVGVFNVAPLLDLDTIDYDAIQKAVDEAASGMVAIGMTHLTPRLMMLPGDVDPEVARRIIAETGVITLFGPAGDVTSSGSDGGPPDGFAGGGAGHGPVGQTPCLVVSWTPEPDADAPAIVPAP